MNRDGGNRAGGDGCAHIPARRRRSSSSLAVAKVAKAMKHSTRTLFIACGDRRTKILKANAYCMQYSTVLGGEQLASESVPHACPERSTARVVTQVTQVTEVLYSNAHHCHRGNFDDSKVNVIHFI